MHLKCFALVFIVHFFYSDFALTQQNLLPNGSFEEYSQCPNYIGQIDRANGWTSTNTATPDYLNACAIGNTYVNVPKNFFGYQNAYEGQSYIGICLYDNTTLNYREYIQTELIANLENGKEYNISIFINKPNLTRFITSNLAFSFSNILINQTNNQLLTVSHKEINIGSFNDTLNWSRCTANYIANGTESVFILGNFLDDMATEVIDLGTNYSLPAGYLFLDSISITENPLNKINEIKRLNLYYDSENKELITEFEKTSIYDLSGNLLKIFNQMNIIPLTFLSKGIYLIESSDKKGTVYKNKIII